jgi:hypothetical protein
MVYSDYNDGGDGGDGYMAGNDLSSGQYSQVDFDIPDEFMNTIYGGGNNQNDDKRRFTVIEVDGKSVDLGEGGRYTVTLIASPSDAARKAFSALCHKFNKTSLKFSIRETTRGSKKKVYGPYIGNRTKLSKPKIYYRVDKGKKKTMTIKHKHTVKLYKQKAKLGGQYLYS